jgi:hypothetical protein
VKQVTNVAQKYAASQCANPLQMSTLGATAALVNLLGLFGFWMDTYATTLGLNGGGPFHLPEMTQDGVPSTMPLILDIDFAPVNLAKKAGMSVGICIQMLRMDQGNAANAIAGMLGENQDTILAQYVRALHPEIVAELNAKAAAVVAVEDAAPSPTQVYQAA